MTAGKVRFLVQEIDNDGTVLNDDVGAFHPTGLTYSEAIELINQANYIRKSVDDCPECGTSFERAGDSWFAAVPYTDNS